LKSNANLDNKKEKDKEKCEKKKRLDLKKEVV
jgi:hypothetical protein